MELVMLGSNAFAHIVEALILWISMSQMYETKYKQLFTGCSIFLGHIVMFAVFLTNNIYAITVINLLVYIFLIMFLYDVNKRSAVFWGVILIVMMALSELIMFYTARYIVGIKNAGKNTPADIIFMGCLCNIFYFLIVQALVFIRKRSVVFDRNDMSKILLIGSLTTSLIVFMTYYIIGTTWSLHRKESIWMMISSVGLVCSDILILWTNIRIDERNAENECIKIQLEQEKADAKYYRLENEKNESLEILRHDMNNHLNTMLAMQTDDDLREYITSIMEPYNIKKRTTFSKNNVLNGLISEYTEKCYTENIGFVVDIRPDTIDDIVATDIVALFGNILSNAYEAARNCAKSNGSKYIELIVKRKNETIFIKCINSCFIPPKIINGRYISAKKDTDKKHGYGMKSIQNIVGKYNGSHFEQFDEQENEFTISIMLMK